MATNQYVDHYNCQSEQDLAEDLVIEAIQMKGVDLFYLPKTHVNYDYLYGEDTGIAFQDAVTIEMYPAFVEGFGGGGFMVTELGDDIQDTATFVVSKKRVVDELQATFGISRPMEGDLLYFPITNSYLTIKFVNDESPFFQHGKQYVWEVKTQLFEFSYEDFDTGEAEIDDGITPDFDTGTDTEDYGDNTELDTEADPIKEFDPNNPFG